MTDNRPANRIDVYFYKNADRVIVANVVVYVDNASTDFSLGLDPATADAQVLLYSQWTGYPVYRIDGDAAPVLIESPRVKDSWAALVNHVTALTAQIKNARDCLALIPSLNLFNPEAVASAYWDNIDQAFAARVEAEGQLAALMIADPL